MSEKKKYAFRRFVYIVIPTNDWNFLCLSNVDNFPFVENNSDSLEEDFARFKKEFLEKYNINFSDYILWYKIFRYHNACDMTFYLFKKIEKIPILENTRLVHASELQGWSEPIQHIMRFYEKQYK
jgi:hypothetical protein